MSSGALRRRSSTSSPSEIRVLGWICSSRASRGSWPAASRVSSRTLRAVRARCSERRARDPGRRRRPTARRHSRPGCAPRGRGRVAESSSGTADHLLGQLAVARAPAGPGRDRRPGDRVRCRADDEPEVARAQAQLVDVGLRSRLPDRPDARRSARSRRPCRPPSRIGQAMSASVTSRSSITNPPSSIRLWAMNWRRKSAIAGPGHATHPSASRNRRWPSRGSSASRSWSWRMNSIRLRSDLTGSSRRKPVRLAHAGSAQPPNTRSASSPAAPAANCSGIPNGIAEPRVDRAAERDHRAEASAAAVGGGLVAEHPALRIARRGGRRWPVSSRT